MFQSGLWFFRLIAIVWLFLPVRLYANADTESCQSDWLEPPVLKVVTTPFPPYVVDYEGLVAGPATEVVREVCQRAGVRCEFHALPWARSYHLAQTEPDTLIYSMSRNAEREPYFEWVGTVSPYDVKIFAIRGSIVPEVADWRELAGFRVAGQLKDVKALFLAKAGFEVDFTGTAENTIQMLYHDRVHLVAGDARSLPYRVGQLGLPLEQLRVVADIGELSSDLYLAANSRMPVAVLQRLSGCLRSMKSDGAYERIWEGV
ncbi:substrate-binding periplasmic protein [Saccharospirillum salsuginis]|uniref:Solute-binding protein family 3/N-terminal domain-containing protein n=1 Tax=Saccharospirillum salsuginis TaxID=418750 RepID=A0A918KK47_9GAMM|nr:transporter substrate-binding domain-containing protein [Saccharospirillum salsuginis]GGX66618.1 hypothetical protein GCM10007392_37940 [Saccharospirillum salsuginis]